jgi:hypothetical protein
MESWCVGFEGDEDVERHAGMHDARPAAAEKPRIRVRVVSDYI